MKKQIFFLLFALSANIVLAQFPGGGGGNDRQGTRNNNAGGGWGPPGQQQQKQTKGMAKISGIILDSASNKPVEFANIALYNQATNKLIDGTVADEKGKFSLEGLVDGTYRIQVTFLGYNNQTIKDIRVINERNVGLPIIKLGESTNQLQEVTVTGIKALIEEKVDRIVYNAEKDQLAKGGDASDVLKKVPMVQVDLDGNVTVRGSSSIKVLLNGKPSTIVASSIADALRMVPADQIKSVEVITSPSARYDAEGAAGIINIIMKKEKMQGYSLNMDVGAGLRASNLGLNGSYRSGKFGVTLGGHGRAMYNAAETNLEQNTILKPSRTVQSATANDLGIHGNYNLGMDYDIDKTQSITGNVRYGARNFGRDQLLTSDVYLNGATTALRTIRQIDNRDLSNNVDVNLDYLRQIGNGREWSISTQYSRNDLTNNFISNNLNVTTEAILNRLKNANDNLNQEITVQTDYQTPIGTNQMWEIGAKGIFRTVNSDFQYFNAEGSTGDYILSTQQPAGNLDYGQNIAAAYSTYSVTTKNKFTVKGGLRYEHTSIEATQNNADINIKPYQNVIPSLNVSKSLKNMTTLKAGYNRRLQRPGLQQLNPNLNILNAQNISQGNPNLEPELSDNVELGISTMLDKTYINLSVFGRFTNNLINQVRTPIENGVILTTYQNVGKQNSYGTNLNTNIYLTQKWSISGGLDLFYAFLEGQVKAPDGTNTTAKNEGFNFGGRLMSQLSLKNGWGLQAFSFVRGRQVELQGVRGGYGMYSIGGRKEFKNKKGSIGMSFENFATRGWNIRSELTTADFTQLSNNLMLNRNVKINLTYKFGKLNFVDAKKKAKGVRNDDVMGGGDGGGMSNDGGGQQGGGGQARPQQGAQGRPQTGAPQGGNTQPAQGPNGTTPEKAKDGKEQKEVKPTKKTEGEPKKSGE